MFGSDAAAFSRSLFLGGEIDKLFVGNYEQDDFSYISIFQEVQLLKDICSNQQGRSKII
jgi:hypothetical protein